MSAASYPLFGRRSVFVTAAVIAVVLGCQFGCVATLISYGGPGSWKREALWDEYVVTLVNHGERPLTIDSATLADSAGTPYAPGSDPWALEKQSKKLEKQYRKNGQAFVRAAGPGVLIVGAGAATVS